MTTPTYAGFKQRLNSVLVVNDIGDGTPYTLSYVNNKAADYNVNIQQYKLNGRERNDTLGEGGKDTLSGGAGSGVLIDGTGNDALKGGEGTSTCCFDAGDGKDTTKDGDSLGEQHGVCRN